MKTIIALYAFSITLILATLSGCAAPGPWATKPIPVYIGPTVVEKCGTARVDEALSFWADLGVDYLVPVFELPAKTRVYGITVLYVEPKPGSKTLGQALTYHTDIGGVSTIVLYGCYPRTLEHEIGHSLGLPHHKDPNNLMYPYNNGGKNTEITQDQLGDLDSN
jgi:hypothetical protein